MSNFQAKKSPPEAGFLDRLVLTEFNATTQANRVG